MFFKSCSVSCVPSLLIVLFLTLGRSTIAAVTPNLHYVPAQVANGSSGVQFNARPSSFDGPYLTSVNASVFEWWWFEAVAEDLKSSLTVIFFTTSGNAFPLSGNSDNGSTSVFINALLPNGKPYYNELPATGAILASNGPLGKAAAGNFDGTGCTFAGTPNLDEYVVSLNAPDAGIQGKFTLKSTAPAHYVCSDNLAAGQPLQVFPHIGWANAQPAATVSGTVKIGDQTLNLANAMGYHDHNWGNDYFTGLIKSWYWGHATLGPYSIVWFDGIDESGKEDVSAYIAKDGQILLGSCKPGSLKVRPVGEDATYPPQAGKKSKFEYLHVEMEMADGKMFVAKAVPKSVNINAAPLYRRWIGTISGGVVGETQYKGVTAFEEFTIPS